LPSRWGSRPELPQMRSTGRSRRSKAKPGPKGHRKTDPSHPPATPRRPRRFPPGPRDSYSAAATVAGASPLLSERASQPP
jgi:hypothetical protein